MQDTLNLLNYWYKLEFFSPYWPGRDNYTVSISDFKKNIPPWISKPNQHLSYDVYIGKVRSQYIISEMLKSIGKENNDLDIDYSLSCICAFKVTGDGLYVDRSFSVSTFMWAISEIIKEKTLTTNLDPLVLSSFNNKFDSYLCTTERVGLDDLRNIHREVLHELDIPGNQDFWVHINRKLTKTRNNRDNLKKPDGEQADEWDQIIDVTTDMMPSFYISDIDMIRKKIQSGDHLIGYIKAMINPVESKIEIDTDIEQMQKWLSPEKYPLGKWPSIHSPSLMQQIAINIAISDYPLENKFFSINGPPGTGKTTLLKEIIASNVVERALLLSRFDKPDDAFIEYHFPEPNEKVSYFEPDPCLLKYGIIIGSNNNAAVENISLELPLTREIEKGNTGLFNPYDNKDVYFTKIASSLLEDKYECWGLISARLGNFSNIKNFKQAFWGNFETYYQGTVPDWKEAKENYISKYNEVIEYRSQILQVIENKKQHNHYYKECVMAREELLDIELQIKKNQDLREDKMIKQEELVNSDNTESMNLGILNSRIPLIKKLLPCMFKKDPSVIAKRQTEKRLYSLAQERVNINYEIDDLKKQLGKLERDHNNKQNLLWEKEQIYLDSKEKIGEQREAFGNNYTDDKFWIDIKNNEKSQSACPWTNKEYDTLREELFYYALMLHKAFLLNSNNAKHNIECLNNMWSNKYTERDKIVAYPALLNTLLLAVPVISTTFASVHTFLKHIGKEQLGLLIIDEAGQAAPHSSLGALWRTQKSIIVGDPLQVEPFSTVPIALCNKFAEEYKIPSEYRVQELSVQALADHINAYGGYRKYEGNELWLGCPLVIHRRCMEPMFSISNRIAYNKRMFFKTANPDKSLQFSMDRSVWIDIKGKEKGNKDHTVEQQTEKVISMVEDAFDIQNGFPDLYIISPFKSVCEGIKSVLQKTLINEYPQFAEKDIGDWLITSCGTIHTFQGKEASEVILVLGCDEISGAAAADWAGNKLNILNVAVTRAKHRIAIIGDSKLWAKYPNFALAYRALNGDSTDVGGFVI